MSLFPMFLKLQNRHCLLVGAGNVALEKIPSLLQGGARLTVVAPRVRLVIEQMEKERKLTLRRGPFQAADLAGVFLVVAATGSAEVNHAIFLAAQQRGILCNSVDDPSNCDFYFSSIVQRGNLQIAISTAGESPAFAQRLRREIDAQLSETLGEWLAQIGNLRREMLAAYPSGEDRKLLLHQLAQRSVCESKECPARQLKPSAAAIQGSIP